MSDAFRIAALVPTFNDAGTIARVVESLARHVADVWVVDDGGGPEARAELERLAAAGAITLVTRPRNGGKGAAVRDGLEALARAGFSHALQIDADGQHDVDDVPRFLAVARRHPEALVLGSPQFDASAPRARRWGRAITVMWCHVETLGRVIDDPMCGFRVYPIAATLSAGVRSSRMDFDPEVAVATAWRGCSVVNVPTRVRYPAGGVSRFRMVRDNLLISWMHTRMVLALVWRAMSRRRPRRLEAS